LTAYGLLLLSYLFGSVSVLSWLAFLFHGSLNLVDLGLDETRVLCLNTILSLVFFVQHSVMVRTSFRRRMARFVRTEFHGALYTIASGIVLLSLVLFWQRSAHTWVTLHGIPRLLVHAAFGFSIAGFSWGARALRPFDMFGARPILRHLQDKTPPPGMPLRVQGPYRWVRHPLYLFCLLMIWSCPELTADRLLYNVLWSGWIILGTLLEERDLVASFGKAYRDYQTSVPMLLPRSIRPALAESAEGA